MSHPLVIGYHLIWTAYGWWLPNDPRGSMSRQVCTDVLRELGDRHYGRKRVQPASATIRAFYDAALPKLKHDLLAFDPAARSAIGAAFARAADDHRYTCYACAVMPDHVHVVIRKHRDQAEEMIANLQESSRLRLRNEGHRAADHPVWGGPGWKVFLHSLDEFRRTIDYVEQNPIKQRMPAQRWPFVTAYDDWPFHAGHSPNSPYAKRLRDAAKPQAARADRAARGLAAARGFATGVRRTAAPPRLRACLHCRR